MVPCDSPISLWSQVGGGESTYQPDNILQVDLCRVQGIHEQGEKASNDFQLRKECLNTRRYHRLGTGRWQESFQTVFPLVQSLLAGLHESIIR